MGIQQPVLDFDPIDARNPLVLPPLASLRRRATPYTAAKCDPAAVSPAARTPPARAAGIPLPGTGEGESIGLVVQARLEQVARWGHTAESDAERPLREFLRDLRCLAHAAEEDHQFHPRQLDRLKGRLVRLCALGLATVDRVAMEPTDEGDML